MVPIKDFVDFANAKYYKSDIRSIFSYSHPHIDRVYQYVMNQKEHHKKKSFRKEYIEMLKMYEITYDEKYMFEWFD